jgi:hypothetical protein
VWGDCLSHYPVVSTHKNCAVRQVMAPAIRKSTSVNPRSTISPRQNVGRRRSFSLSGRARHRTASSSKAPSSRATPTRNSIWATRTRARRARLRGSFGARFSFDNGLAEGTAIRGKYAHYRKCTCPSCMTVYDATLVHVGEVRTFGATASQRGAPILSSLCGHFQPQLKVKNTSFPSQMLILIFSVC